MQNYSPKNQPDVNQLIDSSREVLIVLGRNPNFDAVSSGLSLYLSLSSAGKRATIVSPSQTTVEFSHLVGADKISTSLNNGGRNLVVSFPYQEGSIEKVSYNIENETFNLVIEPREGYPIITPDKLSYSFGGGTYDLIFVVNAANLNELDNIYSANQNLFNEKQVINIDNNPSNQRFGKLNFVDPNSATVSEMVTNLLNSWGMKIDPDIASNLLAGITAGSNNFTSTRSNVATFEAATMCMKNGARKLGSEVQSGYTPTQQQPYQFPTQYNQPAQNYSQYKSSQPTYSPQTQRQMPSQQQIKPQPSLSQQSQRQPQRPTIKPQNQPQQNQGQQPKKQEAPPDWLKPKIYKGSTLL